MLVFGFCPALHFRAALVWPNRSLTPPDLITSAGSLNLSLYESAPPRLLGEDQLFVMARSLRPDPSPPDGAPDFESRV